MKNIKINYVVCLLLSVIMLFVFAPCSSSATSGKLDLKITTGSSGGSWFATGAVISEILKKDFPGSSVLVVPGGGVTNVALVGKGESDIGFSYIPNVVAGRNGSEPYTEKFDKVSAIALMEPSFVFGFATKDSKIISYEQIAEEEMPIRLGVAPVGHFAELSARRILEQYGITYDKIKKWGGKVQHLSHPEATNLFRDGHLDLYIASAGLGHAAVTEMCMIRDMVFLSIEGQPNEELCSKFGYYPASLPSGSFKGIEKEVPVVGYSGILIANVDIEDEVAYALARGIYEGHNDIANAYKAIENRPAEDVAKVNPIPLHPGAERYYKEKGLIK